MRAAAGVSAWESATVPLVVSMGMTERMAIKEAMELARATVANRWRLLRSGQATQGTQWALDRRPTEAGLRR